MIKLYLMRHGETIWNEEKRYQGHLDSPLTEKGKNRIRLQKKNIKNLHFSRVYCSPLGRTRSTLNILEPQSDTISFDHRLKEIRLGLLQGKTRHNLTHSELKAQELFWSSPDLFSLEGAETMADLEKRVLDFLNELPEEGTILLLTHTVIIKMILKILESRAMENLWDDPYLHPGTILIIDPGSSPCVKKVIHPEKNMEEAVSYTA